MIIKLNHYDFGCEIYVNFDHVVGWVPSVNGSVISTTIDVSQPAGDNGYIMHNAITRFEVAEKPDEIWKLLTAK